MKKLILLVAVAATAFGTSNVFSSCGEDSTSTDSIQDSTVVDSIRDSVIVDSTVVE